jgi:hypothetical protein
MDTEATPATPAWIIDIFYRSGREARPPIGRGNDKTGA